ncbi:MAG: DEAD/DEAH box helicase, partial [Kiritimatiellae bacterium]|nr:DEAD/DEAH box helicase [Kiritimatiellia bacterium]
MTPADFDSDLLVSWGGAEVFNQALSLVNRGNVVRAEWDDKEHVISGAINTSPGYAMKTSVEVLDDGTVISHCPCAANRDYGMVCPHVVALGIHQMVTFMPDEAEAAAAAEEDPAAYLKIPDEARTVPDVPRIRVELSGSRAALGAEVWADYPGGVHLPCGGDAEPGAACRQDSDDPDLFHVRNPDCERSALALLRGYGFEEGVVGMRNPPPNRLHVAEPRSVLNFLGSGLPYLRRQRWIVHLSDRLMAVADAMPMVIPVVTIHDGPRGSFDVSCSFDAGGRGVSPAAIQTAINRGDSYVLTNGETLLVDTEAVAQMRAVFADCARTQGGAAAGSFRVSGIYAPYVRASLDALDAVAYEDDQAPNWRETARARNRDEHAKYETVDLGPLENVLRPYQKDGVYWMRFLEKSGLSGLLADEMGLGKTLQTLAWLSLRRTDPDARGLPALIVCPTSLVRNWEAEAAKFTPGLKTLVVSGPDRARAFGRIPQADLVITSYALLQRDLEDAYLGQRFSVAVLDEAQHIKNRATRNARAAKRIDAVRKLVLTGTPVENSVADVWSIFDFLLPDYLGDYASFKDGTEAEVAAGGKTGRQALERLHNKLHPFILRRLKKDVAKDLPDKVEKVAYCTLSAEQQRLTAAVRAKARAAKTKFEMLAVLMKLRQIANHPGLVDKDCDLGAEALSGKLESFFEILDEAMDGGHRVLVFSQFVKMLAVLRKALEKRGVDYCYLDGQTKDRLGECKRFNRGKMPVMLISLMAGGTGLNLTGADVVVHFDPWWNPAVENQATDRAHRIGQKKTVCVVKLISEDSVEERVLKLQRKKQLVIDATVSASDEAIVS